MTSPSERQAEADDNARAEEAYITKREALIDAPLELNRLLGRIADALEGDEQSFWDRAFLETHAAIVSGDNSELWQAAKTQAKQQGGGDIGGVIIGMASMAADAALIARRQRLGDDQ